MIERTVTHSKNFEKVRYYYTHFKPNGERYWDIDKVREAVVKGWITESEYQEITNEPY